MKATGFVKGELFEPLRANVQFYKLLSKLSDSCYSPLEDAVAGVWWNAFYFKEDLDTLTIGDVDVDLATGLIDTLREVAQKATEYADAIEKAVDELDI